MRPRIVFLSLALLLSPVAAARVSADAVMLAPAQDNTLYENASGALSNGAGPTLFAGRTAQPSGSIRRGLLRFDIAGAIPPGATIQTVLLILNMSQSTLGTSFVGLHRAHASWGEGTSNAGSAGGGGAPATAGDATWLHRFSPSTFWGAAGGDFAPGASASVPVNELGLYSWGTTSAMVADVQSWLDTPATNFGWLLRGDESVGGTAKRFDTRENPTPDARPSLSVVFEPPGTPAQGSSWGRIKGLYR
ncbi:MAG: DNRLRE domain-containing protein [Candidatus Eiseniibacteriota bacterium]